MRQRGVATERWSRWQEKNRGIVQRRAGFKCEACGTNLRPLELAHLCGRNNKGISEPWASSAELTAALCASGYGIVGCHAKIDRDLDRDLLDRLRRQALERLEEEFGGIPRFLPIDPLDAIRMTVSALDESWVYDSERNEVVKV
jgi:hypothetical protein